MKSELDAVRQLIDGGRWVETVLSLIDLLPEEETGYYAGAESESDALVQLQEFLGSIGRTKARLNSTISNLEGRVMSDAWGVYVSVHMIDINDIALLVSLTGSTPRFVLVEPVANGKGELTGWVLSYAGTIVFGSLAEPLAYGDAVTLAKAICRSSLGWEVSARRAQ